MMLIGSNLLKGVVGVRQPSNKSDLDLILFPCELELFEEGMDNGYIKYEGNHPKRKSYYYKHDTLPAIEVEVAEEGSTALELADIYYRGNKVSNIDLAYTLKMSHRFLRNSPHFEKTWYDLRDLRKIGAEIPECLKEWLVKREAETYYYKHPNLNQSKGDFFDTPNVEYIHDHDSIHEAIAIDLKPAYTNFLIGEVKTSKELFESLDVNIRLNAVLEEAATLAIERSLVFKEDPDRTTIDGVWLYSLQKVCTSITSGWFREFAWNNYDLCKRLYYSRISDYYDNFYIQLLAGNIKPHIK